jgi:Asp-tRNA(Asn)/Glu-tRNA(Gln) amidotransferase B subunit
MPQVMKKGAGKVDGNVAQSIVKELLSKKWLLTSFF